MPPRRRMLIWAAGLVAYVVLMVPVGTLLLAILLVPPWGEEGVFGWVSKAGDVLRDTEWWGNAMAAGAVIAATQFMFLLPVLRLKPPQGTRPRSLTRSLVVGTLLAALLTTALGLGVIELAGNVVLGNFDEDPWRDELFGELWMWPAVIVMLVGSWAFWTTLLLVFSRRLWPDTVIGRVVVLLLGGTIVELLVVLPIDVMVRRRTDCYCAAGTFWSLCVSAVGLMWLTGPGIVFALTSRRRKAVRRRHCGRCGQAKGPTPGSACPECGYEWRLG